ncbi:gluconokinase [Nocardia sp. NBC_01503]|uniref:gluconokinase n=1 Tax=Nocardia sp. NBC_01503 TaxID=2975997 RepID=UPI002E7AD8D7|nr:gluconokinase [Nocardia sp. NBC_01503]WTL29598.1 gluconokinase [Nocardia sp. NBC_01503]
MSVGDPHIVVVMGVSGSGKSTVAAMLAETLGWDLLEGDDLHPAANVAKMAAGHPLADADRQPWLEAIAAWMADHLATGRSGLVTCSALKHSYRDTLRRAAIGHPGDITFLLLHGTREQLRARVTARKDHFMPPGLLDSQLDTLEPPTPDEHIITVEIGPPPAEVAVTALAAVRKRTGGAG